MPTLQEIMDGFGGDDALNKIASDLATTEVTDEIEKLALEIGLDSTSEVNKNLNTGHTKEANMGLEHVYNNLFPGDVIEKTASLTKEAAEIEEAMGKFAYDAFQSKVDDIITKIAEEKIADGSAIDAEAVQAVENNRGGTGPINTTPSIDNELPAESGAAVVGDEKQQKHAALMKHLLLNQIGGN